MILYSTEFYYKIINDIRNMFMKNYYDQIDGITEYCFMHLRVFEYNYMY